MRCGVTQVLLVLLRRLLPRRALRNGQARLAATNRQTRPRTHPRAQLRRRRTAGPAKGRRHNPGTGARARGRLPRAPRARTSAGARRARAGAGTRARARGVRASQRIKKKGRLPCVRGRVVGVPVFDDYFFVFKFLFRLFVELIFFSVVSFHRHSSLLLWFQSLVRFFVVVFFRVRTTHTCSQE